MSVGTLYQHAKFGTREVKGHFTVNFLLIIFFYVRSRLMFVMKQGTILNGADIQIGKDLLKVDFIYFYSICDIDELNSPLFFILYIYFFFFVISNMLFPSFFFLFVRKYALFVIRNCSQS